MRHGSRTPGNFDVFALWNAVDAQRRERDLSWHRVTQILGWMSQDTIARMGERGLATCNHVLPMIEWVGRTPESFTIDPEGAVHELLPKPGERGWRWWWRIRDLGSDLERERIARELTPSQLAGELRLTTREIARVRRSRYGVPIGVAMIIARWLERSAASYMSEIPPQLQVLRFEE